MASPLDALLSRFSATVDPGVVAEVFAQCGGDPSRATHALLDMAGDGDSGVDEPVWADEDLRQARALAAEAEEEAATARRARTAAATGSALPARPRPLPPPPVVAVHAHHPPLPPAAGPPSAQRQYWPPARLPPAPQPPPSPLVAEFSSLGVGTPQHHAPPSLPSSAWAAGPGRAGAPPVEPAATQPVDPVALSFLCDLFAGVGPGLVRDILAMACGEVGPAVEALADIVGGGGVGGSSEDGEADLAELLADLGAGSAVPPAAEAAQAAAAAPDPLAELFPRLHPATIRAARDAAGGDDDMAASRLMVEAEFIDRLDRCDADAALAARLAAEFEEDAARADAARTHADRAADNAVTPTALAALAARFPGTDGQILAGALRVVGTGGGVELAASILADALGLEDVPPDPDAGFEAVVGGKKARTKKPAASATTEAAKGKAPATPPPVEAAPAPAVANGRVSAGAGASWAPAPKPAPGPPGRRAAAASSFAPAPPSAPASVDLPRLPPQAAPPPFASGKDVYDRVRPQIRKLQAHAKRLAVQAAKAWKGGNDALANQLKAEQKAVVAALERAGADAVRETLRATNAAKTHVLNETDVHFMHVPEAIAVVGVAVCHLIASPAHHMGADQVQAFITGRGNRSYDGKAKLAPAVGELMARAGVPHAWTAGGGRLVVTIPGAGKDGWDADREDAAYDVLMAAVRETRVDLRKVFRRGG